MSSSPQPFIVHADWSIDPRKRWMAVIQHGVAQAPEPVGPPETLLARLRARAEGAPVAFGIDCPLGLPRAYVARHHGAGSFPQFLRRLQRDSAFLTVASRLDEVGADRPFYPMRGAAGMTRLAHAQALGLTDADALCRACDRATPFRAAGAPVFWTLGANQSGKAALSAWRDLVIPGLHAAAPLRLWPFDGGFNALLSPGVVGLAETYPADAMVQLGLKRAGSKRRQSDRAAYAPLLLPVMSRLGVGVAPALHAALSTGFGAHPDGEDRLDSLFGVLCVFSIVTGQRQDTVPNDPWITTWEGWVLGQAIDSTAVGYWCKTVPNGAL